MKKHILYLLFLPFGLCAQECEPAALAVPLTGNNIKAVFQSNGVLFDGADGGIFAPVGSDITALFFGGIWLGGLDPLGNIRLVYQDFGTVFKNEFYPGILDADGTLNSAGCVRYNRFWSVAKNELESALSDYSDNGTVDNPPEALLAWPAIGNPYFEFMNGFELPAGKTMAPFFDRDGDGSYDPFQGDLPQPEANLPVLVLPANLIWFVFNDDGFPATDKIPVEIQFTAWSFNCVNDILLHNTVFSSWRIENRSTTVLDSARFGYFADFDIGCHADDFVGCVPQQNTFYAYNADNFDDPGCLINNNQGYQYNPPVQAVTFLNRNLDGYIYYLNSSAGTPPAAMTDPNSKAEYYSYLTSRWKDVLPYTYGGNGYDPAGTNPETSFVFPGDPNNDAEWSMVSANIDPSTMDCRNIALNNIGTFSPGDAVRFDLAYSWHRGSSLSNLENVTLMQQRLPVLIDLYNNNFAGSCAAVSSAHDPNGLPALDIYPNPSDGMIHLQFPQQRMAKLAVYDISGNLVLSYPKEVYNELEVDLTRLPAGIYFLHATIGQQAVREKIVLTN